MKVTRALLPAVSVGLLLTDSVDAEAGAPSSASAWEIGPVINGRNYSRGSSRPLLSDAGLAVAISPSAEPHYVTFRHGSLRGKRQVRLRFRVEGPRGAIIYGAKCPIGSPSGVTLFFQRQDDDWASDGGRWWATFATVSLKGPMGETEIVAPLDGKWTSVVAMTAANSPNEFAAAKAYAGRVGFTFANCQGFGHGARATMPVRFVVTRFQVL